MKETETHQLGTLEVYARCDREFPNKAIHASAREEIKISVGNCIKT